MDKTVQRYSREYKNKLTCGFIGIENELLQMFGMHTFVITGIGVTTVEEQPNLFQIQMNFSSYNQTQKRQEHFFGISPLEGSKLDENSGSKVTNTDIHTGIEVDDDNADTFNVFVSKSDDTWSVPIIHDCFMEELLQGLELYPDLELPSYQIVNAEIERINAFRKLKGLREIYTDKGENGWVSELKAPNPHTQYVDPDFYIFYPSPYVLGLVDETLTETMTRLGDSPAANMFDSKTLDDIKKSKDPENAHNAINDLLAGIMSYGAAYSESLPTLEDIKSGKFASDVGTEELHYQMSCYDMFKYNKHGTMLRAFPTYMFVIVDEGQSVGGVRLWSNYYAYHSMISASVIRDMDNPVDVCEMTLTNIYHTLNTMPQYTATEMQWLDEHRISSTGQAVGQLTKGGLSNVMAMMFPSMDERLVEMKRKMYDFCAIQPGARIHLRLGYGQDTSGLPVVFNGTVASVTGNEILEIIAQGDGGELINPLHNVKPGERAKGRFSEPRMALCNLLCEHGKGGFIGDVEFFTYTDKAFNMTNAYGWGMENAHGVEHFGKAFLTGGETGVAGAVIKAISQKFTIGGVGASDYQDVFIYEICKNIYPGGIVSGVSTWWDTSGKDVTYQENADYERDFWSFGEKDIEMYQFGKSIWDMGKYFCLASPEYIISPHTHHFRSTLFFGRPHWMCRYAYAYIGNKTNNLNPKDEYGDPNERLQDSNYVQLSKPFMQFHMCNSYLDIIDNGIVATSENLITCSIVTYNTGTDTKKATIWADRNIAPECIKSAYLDTTFVWGIGVPIVNGVLHAIGMAAGFNNLSENAYQAGVTHLCDSFRHMYDGQILMLGSPALKPYDCLYVGDYFNSIFGCSNVRRVVHSIDVGTGFITSVTPGLISFGRNINTSKIDGADNDKLVKTYGAFLMLGSNYDMAMTASLTSHIQAFWKNNAAIAANASSYVGAVSNVLNTALMATGAAGTAITVGSSLGVTFGAGATAFGAATMGAGFVIAAILVGAVALIKTCVDFYLKQFTEYYTSTVMVMPLFIKDKPMLAGVKGHKTLLPPGIGDYSVNSNMQGSDNVIPAFEHETQTNTSNDNSSDIDMFREQYKIYEQRMLSMVQNKSYSTGAVSIFEYIKGNAPGGLYDAEDEITAAAISYDYMQNQINNFSPVNANMNTLKASEHLQETRKIVSQLTFKSNFKSQLDDFKNKYEQNQKRYEAVAQLTDVPPELIAAIHFRESSMRFNTYLHNGEPLGQVTKLVPKGKLFYDWETAAVDALNDKDTWANAYGLSANSKDIAAMAAYSERYNGMGYFNEGLISAYVYSGTSAYTSGKYVADGKFDANYIDKQVGIVALIKSIMR